MVKITEKGNNVSVDFPFSFSSFYNMGFVIKQFCLVRLKISKKKLPALFSNIGGTNITFHKMFVYEVIIILEELKNSGFRGARIEWLEDAINQLRSSNYSIDKNKQFDYNKIKKVFKFTPLPDQLPAYDYFEKVHMTNGIRGGINDAETGSGKTFMSCSLAELFDNDIHIIVTPLRVKEDVWVKSVSTEDGFYVKPRKYLDIVNKNFKYKNEKVAIVHYEALPHAIKFIEKFKGTATVTVDECHNFNDITSNRSEDLIELCTNDKVEDVILMSGTVVKDSVNNLLPFFKIIYGHMDRIAERRFLLLYKSPSSFLRELLISRYRNASVKIKKDKELLPDLHSEIIKHPTSDGEKYTLTAIRRDMQEYYDNRLKDLLDNEADYANKFYLLVDNARVLYLGNMDKEFKSYLEDIKTIKYFYSYNKLNEISHITQRARDFENKYIRPKLSPEDKKVFDDVKTVVKYLKLKVRGEILGRIVLRKRIECYMSLASEIDYSQFIEATNRKVLIFSSFVEVLKACGNKLNEQKYKHHGIYGDTTTESTQILAKFEKDKSRALTATYNSLSEGVPVLPANITLLLDLPFRFSRYEQTVARTYRIGQKFNCYIYKFLLDTEEEKNITDRNLDIITWSMEQIEEITGESKDMELMNKFTDLFSSFELNPMLALRNADITKHVMKTIDEFIEELV